MTDDTPEHFIDLGTGLEALRGSGLLYELNTRVLHPLGHEARVVDDQLRLYGDGRHVKQWTPTQVGDPEAQGAAELQRRVALQTFLTAQEKNWDGYWKGHSPGFNGTNAGAQT